MKELIDEMAYDLAECHVEFLSNDELYTDYDTMAQKMVSRGYRKQIEVAREIFEEIDKIVTEHSDGYCCDWYLYELIAELKKKYTGVE